MLIHAMAAIDSAKSFKLAEHEPLTPAPSKLNLTARYQHREKLLWSEIGS